MSTMQNLSLTDGPITFAGALSLERLDDGVRPWRLPYQLLDLVHPSLQLRAGNPAGVRVSLISDTSKLRLNVRPIEDPAEPIETFFDLLVDGQLHQRKSWPAPGQPLVFDQLPPGEHRLEVYLPQHNTNSVVIQQVQIDAGASASRFEDTRPRWTVYGSSITQCGAAAGPSETWPALVAQQFDLNLTCLGFGGNCHAEPLVAQVIRDLPADYISLCVGINICGSESLNERTFRSAVIGLIRIIREKHPLTPMVIVSPICNPPRETTPNAVGMTLQLMRAEIDQAVCRLRAHGDEHLAVVNGLDVFGPDRVHHMPDELHPDAEGYRELARQYAQVVMPKLGLVPQAV